MRVLIVNGFSDSLEGRRSFQIFKKAILEAFSLQTVHNVSNIEFTEVDRKSIDEYLYEVTSGYQSKDAEKLFNHLDFVFIDGDANLLPWLKQSKKFLSLIRMCRDTKKILFASTFAMQALVYICATSLHISRVLNGNGRGSRITEFQKIPKSTIRNLAPGDVFVDSATGDIFAWDSHRQELNPVANSGIHNHKDAQDNEIVRKSMLKSSQYWAKVYDNPDQIVIGKSSEVKCRVFKQYVQHWLTRGIGFTELLVPNLNKWDVHPINATAPENVYTVLAESRRGPQIILHNNAVGTQFHVNPKYPVTVTILNNFVVHMMSRFQDEKDRFDVPLASVSRIALSKTRNKESSKSVGFKDNKAKHSGFAFSLRKGEPLTVEVNATRAEAVKLHVKETIDSGSEKEYSGAKQNSLIKKVGFASDLSKIFDKRKDEDTVRAVNSEYLNMLGNEFIENLPSAWKSKKEIRGLLHPGYPTHLIPKKGNLMNGKNLALTKHDFEFYEKPLVKVVVSSKPYCRYNKEFKDREQNTFKKTRTSSFGVLGNTIRNDGSPFVDPDKKLKDELAKNRKKWLSHKDFQTVFTPTRKLRSAGMESSGPNKAHRFREENWEKWIAGPFKIASYL